MSKWIDLGLTCEHCGKPIESKPDPKPIEIKGFESMKHRHIHNQSEECVITTKYTVNPYSNLGIRDKYYEQLFKQD